MEGENPHHGHQQHQSEVEAAIDAAAHVVVEQQVLPMQPMQEEAVAAADDDAADRLYLDLDLDAVDVEQDEAFAQALYMEELMQVEEDWNVGRMHKVEEDWNVGPFDFEEPPPRHAGVFAGEEERLPIPAVHHQFAAGQSFFNDTTHHVPQQPVGRGEAITVRLEPRIDADALISAREAVLGQASAPAVRAGVEEEHDNSWYESVLEAQRIEEMEEEPGAYHEASFQLFQTQLPSSTEPKDEPCFNSTNGWDIHMSDNDFDPDEPGPSTRGRRPPRVPPLADDEMPKFNCGICLETLPILDLFHGMQCQHRFCVECMATYIEGRIHAGEVPIPCPDPACREKQREDSNSNNSVLHPEECKKSIDFAAFGNWGIWLTESAIPVNRRAYCPNEQCGVMLEATGGKTPALAFCPVCSHPMCATCGLDWSSDDSANHDCTEGPGAAALKKLVEKREWKLCPRCNMLVEKTGGCNVKRCRCRFVFCYACGLPTGRQTGMEEGAELCQCHNTHHPAP